MGGLAATAACPKAAEGTRPLITVALARMNSFVEEKMRDGMAATFRSFPEGEDPRRAQIIVGLLRENTRRGVEHTAAPESRACENVQRLISYKENSCKCDFN